MFHGRTLLAVRIWRPGVQSLQSHLRMERDHRKVAACWCAYASVLLLLSKKKRTHLTKKSQNTVGRPLRVNWTFTSVTSIYTDEEFSGAFRMSRPIFTKLWRLIECRIQKNVEMGKRSKRTTVMPDMRLGITLRLLAGADIWDLIASYHVRRSTIHRIFEETVSVLNVVLRLPGLPKTRAELYRSSIAFKTSRKALSPLDGCVGALDGLAVKITKPREEENPASYYNRIGFYALCVQAMVDSNYRFMTHSCRCVGSTHDSLSHETSSLGRYLKEGRLCKEFWIAADEAYLCTESVITPVPSSQVSDAEDAFNFYHSSLRMHVEQAFGILGAKWGILQRPLRYAIRKSSRIVCTAMKLHNFVVDEGDSRREGITAVEFRQVYTESLRWHRQMTRSANSGRQTGRRMAGSKKRDSLIDLVTTKRLERPPVCQRHK